MAGLDERIGPQPTGQGRPSTPVWVSPLATYSHVLPTMQNEAVRVFNELFPAVAAV